MVEATK